MNLCLRCGYEWEPRIAERPRNCPGCKSPLWDRAKVTEKEMTRANMNVQLAIQSGKLKRESCSVCGAEKSEAHHEDYSKPLDVIWLCRKHHKQRHRELGGPLVKMTGVCLQVKRFPTELNRYLAIRAAEEGVTFRDLVIQLLTDFAKENGAILEKSTQPKGKK